MMTGMRHLVWSVLLPLGSVLAQSGEQVGREAPVDFTAQIAPILVSRCIECHGPEEQEGDLRLDAREHVFIEGDEDYWVVEPKSSRDSELVRRLGLPLDDDEIMPAKGEPLDAKQRALIARWIDEGADWPEAGDAWIRTELAKKVLPKITFDLSEVDEAGQARIAAAIAALEQVGAVVQRVAADTPAIDVNLSLLRDKVTDEVVAQLVPLAPVLVWLDVGRTGLTDAGAVHLGKLVELRRLGVAQTQLTDVGLRSLQSLTKLERLNAFGTGLTDDALPILAGLPKLQKVYLWQTKATSAGVEAMRDRGASLEVDLGDYVEQRLAAARKEIEARERRNRPVNEQCPVLDKPIKKELFVVHDGRRVAFCCKKCKQQFEADPSKFLAKLPPVETGDAKVEPPATDDPGGGGKGQAKAKAKAKTKVEPDKS